MAVWYTSDSFVEIDAMKGANITRVSMKVDKDFLCIRAEYQILDLEEMEMWRGMYQRYSNGRAEGRANRII
jgi:hypothetical protein